jgi:hypothetical protein
MAALWIFPSLDFSHLIYEGGTVLAVWTIGLGAFCKVKAWFLRLQSKSNTIAFVQKHVLEIPVPKIVYL